MGVPPRTANDIHGQGAEILRPHNSVTRAYAASIEPDPKVDPTEPAQITCEVQRVCEASSVENASCGTCILNPQDIWKEHMHMHGYVI